MKKAALPVVFFVMMCSLSEAQLPGELDKAKSQLVRQVEPGQLLTQFANAPGSRPAEKF